MYIVYKHTNQISGKSYIGNTSKDIVIRWKEHISRSKKNNNRKFDNALRKYPIDSWKHVVLFESNSLKESKQKEIEMISKYDTFINGYNSNSGGGGVKKHTEESKKKISEAGKRECSKETRLKIGVANKGKLVSKEIRKKISDACKGRISPNKNKKLSENHKLKLSQNHSDVSKENNPFWKRKHTEESILKMRLAKLGKKRV
jgi:group I intron endonuclease